MTKIWTIAWQQIYTTFTDRNLLLLMVGLPLAVSVIVGLAFGGSSGPSISDIPVAIVNLDRGDGTNTNQGTRLTSFLVTGKFSGGETAGDQESATCSLTPPEADSADGASGTFSMTLDELLNAEEITDIEAGRKAVDDGEYAVLVIIPETFSQRLSVDPMAVINNSESDGGESSDPAEIEFYVNGAQTLSGSIVSSIIEGFTNSTMGGNIAISSSIATLIEEKPAAALLLQANSGNEALQSVYVCAFTGNLGVITINTQTVQPDDTETLSLTAWLLVSVGSAQAAFMAMFTGMFGALSLYDERRQWTLQRMLMSPTPRHYILAGKMFGTFITVVFQLFTIFVALTLIGSLVEGRLLSIWGTNILAIAVVLLSLALAVSGIGVMIGGAAKSAEQAGAVGPVIMIVLSLLGGAFGFTPPPEIAQFSPVYQGSNALTKLSGGSVDIVSNVIWLVVLGGVLFTVGVFLFNRRFGAE